MYIYEIFIDAQRKKSSTSWTQIIEAMECLASLYWKSGQAYCRDYPVFREQTSVVWVGQTIEKNSLADKYDSIWVKKQKEELQRLSQAKLQFRFRGINPNSGNCVCHCKKTSWYVLFTNYATEAPPLQCGDCGLYVPLYRIPKPSYTPDEQRHEIISKQEYYYIRSWETDYQDCDSLQMSCGFAEKWGQRQMADVNSGLSVQGRELTTDLSERLSAPVYYYLYNYKKATIQAESARTCPLCHRPWFIAENDPNQPVDRLYRFKCDFCRIVSNISFELL